MGKRILFSPVGGTDPIKYLHDGSMLHIADIIGLMKLYCICLKK